jgi:20S proteasome alpha/beta subunit
MTIGIAFKCTDGAVLCADTQMTIAQPYSTKYPGSKIFGFPELRSQPFFTYAGRVDFSTMCIDRIVGRIAEAEKTTGDVTHALIEECKRIHAEYLNLYGDERLTLELLTVLRQPDARLALYRVCGAVVAPFLSSPVECIGVGTPVALSVITPLCPLSMTASQAARIGFYALSQVKRFVDGCGGQTEMVTFRENEPRFGYVPHSEESTRIFEQTFAAFQEAARPILLSYDNVESNDDIFDRYLSEFAKNLKALRSRQIQASAAQRS